MIALTLHIDLKDATPEAEAEFKRSLAAYLTDENSSLIEDFGPDAWGGYDGPTISSLEVADSGISQASWDERFGQTISS